MTKEETKYKFDRQAFSVVSLQEQKNEEKKWWHDKTPHQRLEAIEITRLMILGVCRT